MATLEAVLRVFSNHANRENKLRARLEWLVDTMGWDQIRDRIITERRLLVASATGPEGIPRAVDELGDDPAGVATHARPTTVGQGVPVTLRASAAYPRWEQANVVRGSANGSVSAYAWARLGDITGETFRSWLGHVGGPDAVAAGLTDLDHLPHPEASPEHYVDSDETGPYVVAVGDSECAT
jgi:sulfite reductase beta subunit-like hemoprotein